MPKKEDIDAALAALNAPDIEDDVQFVDEICQKHDTRKKLNQRQQNALRWVLALPKEGYPGTQNCILPQEDLLKHNRDFSNENAQYIFERLTALVGEKVSKEGKDDLRAKDAVKQIRLKYDPDCGTNLIRQSNTWQTSIKKRCGEMYVMGLPVPQNTNNFYVRLFTEDGKPIENSNLNKSTEETTETLEDLFRGLRKISNSSDINYSPANRIQIFGESGVGKSSLLRYIGIRSYLEKIEDKKGCVPFYVSLRRLESKEKYANLFEAIKTSYELKNEDFRKTLEFGKAIILIDGLDVTDYRYYSLVDWVKEFIEEYPDNTFIIASKTEKSHLDIFQKYELKKFTEPQAVTFVERWLIAYYNSIKNSIKDINNCDCPLIKYFVKSFIEYLKEQKLIEEEIFGVPLLLSCLCLIHTQPPHTQTDFGKKIKDELFLYRSAIYELLKWDYKQEQYADDNYTPVSYKNLSIEQRERLLAYIAISFMDLANFQAGTYLNKEKIKQFIIEFIQQPDVQKSLSNLNFTNKNDSIKADEILHGIEVYDGIIVEKLPNEYSFIHSKLQTFFAACYLSRASVDEWQKYFQKYSNDHTLEIFKDAIQLRERIIEELREFLNIKAFA